MSTKHITLNPGDTLVITSPKEVAPQEPEEDVDVFLTIGSVNIYKNQDRSYCSFVSDLDICNDGCGRSMVTSIIRLRPPTTQEAGRVDNI
jgi:hypothetical protein